MWLVMRSHFVKPQIENAIFNPAPSQDFYFDSHFLKFRVFARL